MNGYQICFMSVLLISLIFLQLWMKRKLDQDYGTNGRYHTSPYAGAMVLTGLLIFMLTIGWFVGVMMWLGTRFGI